MKKPKSEIQEKYLAQQHIIADKMEKLVEELNDEGIPDDFVAHSIFLNLGILLSRVMPEQEFNDLISFIKSRNKK